MEKELNEVQYATHPEMLEQVENSPSQNLPLPFPQGSLHEQHLRGDREQWYSDEGCTREPSEDFILGNLFQPVIRGCVRTGYNNSKSKMYNLIIASDQEAQCKCTNLSSGKINSSLPQTSPQGSSHTASWHDPLWFKEQHDFLVQITCILKQGSHGSGSHCTRNAMEPVLPHMPKRHLHNCYKTLGRTPFKSGHRRPWIMGL